MLALESRRLGGDCLSDLALDRLVAGEIARAAHLDACQACASRLASLTREQEDFPRRFWIQGLSMKTLEKTRAVEPAPRLSRRSIANVSAIAMAAMLCIGLFVHPSGTDTRPKGGPTLGLWVRHAGTGVVERLLPGETLVAGDQIRFEVGSDRPGRIEIVGIDSSGPTRYAFGAPIAAGPSHALETTIELDASIGAERFFALVCDGEPPAIESPARQALRQAGGDPAGVLSLGSGCREASFLIQKGPPR